MTGTLSVGGTHADTTKELYVNGDIEVTATLDVGTDASVSGNTVLSGTLNAGATTLTSTLDVTGNAGLSWYARRVWSHHPQQHCEAACDQCFPHAHRTLSVDGTVPPVP